MVDLDAQNIREALGAVDDCKTVENLEAVKKQFEALEIPEIVDCIDREIKDKQNRRK